MNRDVDASSGIRELEYPPIAQRPGPNHRPAIAAVLLSAAFGAVLVVGVMRERRGLAGVGLCLPLVAIVLGRAVRRRELQGSSDRKVATVGVLLAWLGIVAWGVAMLLNVLDRPTRLMCQRHLRGIGQTILLYHSDTKSYPPSLAHLVGTGYLPAEWLICPDSGQTPMSAATTREAAAQLATGKHSSYVYVGAGVGPAGPAEAVLAYEPLTHHEGAGMNVLYNDGSVEWLDVADGQWIIGEIAAGRNPPATRPAAR